MERRMEEQRERMAKEFQEEVRRRQEQEEKKQAAQEAQEKGMQEPKKSTTLVPNSPPVPALRQGDLEGKETVSRNICMEPVFSCLPFLLLLILK